MTRRSTPKRLLSLLLCAAAASPSHAQMDPEKRQLLQVGIDQPVDRHAPLALYAYYHLNVPHFISAKRSLRLVLAPGYADSELSFAKALGEKTDLGVGLAGGAFADSHTEIRQSRFVKDESFKGDGVRGSLSAYHAFQPIGPVPLAGILRVEAHHAKYGRDKTTDPAFAIPEPQTEFNVRTGLRLGGKEHFLSPNLGMELSAWYETRRRPRPMAYGYGGDRRIESDTRLYWGRALLIYNKENSAHRFIAGLSGGGSRRVDRFSAYHLGGDLPMAAEFPLSLPGYIYHGISASRYGLLGGTYIVPVSRDRKTWTASVTVATALVEYATGHEQRGKSHTGVGAGAAYLSRSKAWQVLGSYGYGINARRARGQGGHAVGLLLQFDFQRVQVPFFHPADPESGLHHMLRARELIGTRVPLPKLAP